MSNILVGYCKGISSKNNKPFYKVDLVCDATPKMIDNGYVGQFTNSKFISEKVFNTINQKMLGKSIEFEYAFNGFYPEIVGVHTV